MASYYRRLDTKHFSVADGFALALIEAGDLAPNVEHVAPAHEQAEGNEGEHGGERVAAALRAARIFHQFEGGAQTFELAGFQRAARAAAAHLGGGAILGQPGRAHQDEGVGARRLSQSFFGLLLGMW